MVDPWESPVACSHTPVALPRNSPVPSLPIVSSSSCCMVVSYLRFVGFGGGPGVAEPAGEGIDRRPRVRPRPALPTATRRFPWCAVRSVNGRGCDVVAAVAAEDDLSRYRILARGCPLGGYKRHRRGFCYFCSLHVGHIF